MNFASMEYFTVLAQERSFTRAAERLHITQQSLSSHVAGMERELGCRLLVRHIPLELTYAGEVLLRYAAEFQEAHGDMRREFCDISQNQRGVLRVGVAAARGRALLPGTIALFQRDFPNITLALTEGSNDALRQKLAEGSVDLAVADFPDALPDVSLRDFYREAVVLLIEPALFAAVYGERAQACRQAFLAGDFSAPAGRRGGRRRARRPRRPAARGSRAAEDPRGLAQRRDAAGAVRAGDRRVLLPGKSRAHGAGGTRGAAADVPPRRGRGISDPLRLAGAVVPVERDQRVYGLRRARGEDGVLRRRGKRMTRPVSQQGAGGATVPPAPAGRREKTDGKRRALRPFSPWVQFQKSVGTVTPASFALKVGFLPAFFWAT